MRSLLSNYTVTDLGTFGGPVSFATGINSAGEVVGAADTKRYYLVPDGGKNYEPDAFLWKPSVPNGTKGSLTDLNTLGAIDSEADAVNDFGQVVFNGDLPSRTDAFLWTPATPGGASGTTTDLGNLGSYTTYVKDINGIGEVVGTSGDAFLWKPDQSNGTTGSLIDLTASSGLAHATAINSTGQILGLDRTSSSCLWTPSTPNGTSGSFVDLPGLSATCMNDSGEIAGRIGSDLGLYVNGHTYDLGTLYTGITRVDAISSTGQIVGSAHLSTGADHAFLWNPTTPNGTSGTMVDLNTLIGSTHLTLEDATGINDQGQIVGFGERNQTAFAFLLTPTKPTTLALEQLPNGTATAPAPSPIDPISGVPTSFVVADVVVRDEAGPGTWDGSNPAPYQSPAPLALNTILDLALAELGSHARHRTRVNDEIAHPIQAYPLIS
jgi:probable HAF family extracellular repeat protein